MRLNMIGADEADQDLQLTEVSMVIAACLINDWYIPELSTLWYVAITGH